MPEPPAAQTAAATPSVPGTDALFSAVYDRLKAMASRQLARGGGGATLNTTALVHELYLKVCGGRELAFSEPVQFFGYAARAMRTILVDSARRRLCRQRMGIAGAIDIDDAESKLADTSAGQAIELDEALRRLEGEAPRAARLVELHYFAGLSLPQIAELLGVAPRTLNRDWRFARAFLYNVLR